VLDELNALAREVRRLRRELDALKRQGAATRWPRRIGRRPRSTAAGPDAPDAPATSPYDEAHLARFRAEVVEKGSFVREWFMPKIPTWEAWLQPLADKDSEILEIGSFEGLSACYLLWRLPRARLTCVDTFEGNIGDPADVARLVLEQRFDANVALVGAERVTKVVRSSHAALLDLLRDQRRFDLVYVDGSHLALDVLVDAALSWRLLAPDGVLVFDDYEWSTNGDDPLLVPKGAIDAFLTLLEDRYDVLFKGDQVAVRKLGPEPDR
jgi:predicted O-methyltransferase YrrM